MEKQDRQDGVNSIGIIEKEIIEKGGEKDIKLRVDITWRKDKRMNGPSEYG